MKRIFNPDTKDYDVVPSEGYGPNKQLVTDVDGNPRWEDRTHYYTSYFEITVDSSNGGRRVNSNKNIWMVNSSNYPELNELRKVLEEYGLQERNEHVPITVTYNGKEYAHYLVNAGTPLGLCIGESGFLTGLVIDPPFCILAKSETNTEFRFIGEGTHTIVVPRRYPKPVPIPDDFIPSTIQRAGNPLYFFDTNGVKYQLTVGTDGTLSATPVTE